MIPIEGEYECRHPIVFAIWHAPRPFLLRLCSVSPRGLRGRKTRELVVPAAGGHGMIRPAGGHRHWPRCTWHFTVFRCAELDQAANCPHRQGLPSSARSGCAAGIRPFHLLQAIPTVMSSRVLRPVLIRAMEPAVREGHRGCLPAEGLGHSFYRSLHSASWETVFGLRFRSVAGGDGLLPSAVKELAGSGLYGGHSAGFCSQSIRNHACRPRVADRRGVGSAGFPRAACFLVAGPHRGRPCSPMCSSSVSRT
jgi:hypothetical protein